MKSLLISILTVGLILPCISQKAELIYHQFLPEDGLSSRETYCMKIDKNGYIWIGTDNGVSRFDGYAFKNYSIPPGNSENIINAITETTDGTLWFGSMLGPIYYLKNDSLLEYKYNSHIKKFKGKYINATLSEVADDGTVYVALHYAGILKIRPNGLCTLFTNDVKVGIAAIKTKIQYVGALISDNKSVGTVYLNQHKIVSQSNRKPFRFLGSIDDDNVDYFVSMHDILAIKNDKLTKIDFDFPITQIIKYKKGYLIACGLNCGLWYADTYNDLLNGKMHKYLTGYSMSSITIQKEKIWLTTLNDGIIYIPNFESRHFNQHQQVTACEFNYPEGCYFGTSNGDIYFENSDDLKYIKNASKNYIFNMKKIDNKLYFSDLYQSIDTKGKKSKAYFRYVAHNKNQNQILFATHGSYLILDQNRPLHSNFKTIDSSRFIRNHGAYCDLKGVFWLATEEGPYKYQNDKFVKHRNLNLRIQCIAELNDTMLYGSHEYGLIKDYNGQLTYLNTSDGLCDNSIRHIWIDDQKNIWLSSKKGINKISGNTIRSITSAHGLPTNEINMTLVKSNQMWMGTARGFVKMQVPELNRNTPKVFFEKFKANDKSYGMDQSLSLEYNHNNVVLYYKAINFDLREKIKYRYRINKAPWQYTNATELVLYDLKPNSYVIELAAQNQDDLWSESALFSFEVRRPWYTEFWFYSICILALVSLGSFIITLKTSSIKNDAFYKEEINKLERLALQNQMNPHFLSNAFTSLQFLINTNQREKADHFLANLSRLLRLILSSSRHSEVSLKDEIDLLQMYTKLEALRFDHKFETHFLIDPNINLEEVKIPPMMIQPIIENAVNHGLRQLKGRNGILQIKFFLKENSVFCTIWDNGVGRALNQSPKHAHSAISTQIINDRILRNNETNNKKISIKYTDYIEAPYGTLVEFCFSK